MKTLLVPIDKAGRVVLPKDVRDELAIGPGDIFQISVSGDEVTLRPTKEKGGFVKINKALIFSSGGEDVLERESVDAIIEEVRQERGAEIGSRVPVGKRTR